MGGLELSELTVFWKIIVRLKRQNPVRRVRKPRLGRVVPQCPLWVISGRFAAPSRMSAFGGKADVDHCVGECPLIAISGHPAARPKSKIGCTEYLLENAFLRPSQAATHRRSVGLYGQQLISVTRLNTSPTASRRGNLFACECGQGSRSVVGRPRCRIPA